MTYRATPPPPVLPARLGPDGPLLGAADEAFAQLLTDQGLQAWVSGLGEAASSDDRFVPD
jgi:hypothetical protein